MYARFRAPEKYVKWTIKNMEKEYQIQLEWGAKNKNFARKVLRKSRFGAHEKLQSKSESSQKRRNVYIPGLKSLVLNIEKALKNVQKEKEMVSEMYSKNLLLVWSVLRISRFGIAKSIKKT